MKYPYIVNKNGIYYPAGTEVPEGNTQDTEVPEGNAQEKIVIDGEVIGHVEDDVIVVESEEIIKETLKEIGKERDFTKTEINRMTTAELKKLATEIGIEGADQITGSDLKKTLIEKFGL